MKRTVSILAIVMLASTIAFAQEYKKFKVGIGVGYAVPSKGSAGALFYIEPMYRVMDNLAVGFRFESAALAGELPTATSTSVDVSAVGSYTLNGQYYFGSGSSFRPFVGAGFGMFITAAATANIAGTNLQLAPSATSFGFYPRIGFDLGHFNLSIDYNLIPEQSSSVDLGLGNFVTTTQNFSYIGIRVGASIGGGKK
jgi:outer membrane protein W